MAFDGSELFPQLDETEYNTQIHKQEFLTHISTFKWQKDLLCRFP